MSLNALFRTHGRTTNLDCSDIITQLRNADFFQNSLSAGSKNRLRKYQFNLSVTRGEDRPLFDSKIERLLANYVRDKHKYSEVIEYLNKVKDEEGHRFSRNLKIYSKTSKAFATFAEPDHTSFRWNRNYRESLEDLYRLLSFTMLTPLNYTSDEDIINAVPKMGTHSGWTYILSGLKEKGENMDNILERFNIEVANAKQKGSMNKPILVGFRTQASGEFNDDGTYTDTCKHKTRVVCMVDLMQIILELKYAYPVQNRLASLPIYAGGKSPNDISSIVLSNRQKNVFWWSIDYSSFDMTVSSWLIEDVFDVLKRCFKFVDEEEWNIIVHDFIHKDFIVSEGVVHADKGVPSGSMFTQIIDSLVNFVVVNTYFRSVSTKCSMITMGDDNLVFHSNHNITLDTLSSYINKNFGMITNASKSSQGTSRTNPEFLSRFWRNDGQWRHPNLLVSRMLFPERYRDYSKKVKPEHVIYAFILTYYQGMVELMDVHRFLNDYPISKTFILDSVDSRYIPGSMAYIREYT